MEMEMEKERKGRVRQGRGVCKVGEAKNVQCWVSNCLSTELN